MMELWPVWLRPWWLLVVPLLIWLSWQLWHRPHRSGRWQALLPARFHAALLVGGDGQNSRWPWLLLLAAWLLALLALLGPSWQLVEQNALKRADPLVVVLDLSPAMLAADLQPSRLQQAQRKLLDLLQARGEAQTGIVVYAGSAHSLVPLSDDLLTARNLIESLKPSIMPVPGKRADLAISKATQLLQQGAQGKGRILLMTAQLSAEEQEGIRQRLAEQDTPLDILGVGTLQGAPIPQENGSFAKDQNGNILLPRLDDRGLRDLAAELDGRYSAVRLDNQDLDRLGLLSGSKTLRAADEPTQLQMWQDAGHWLLLPLLLLAACAGRRGWLFCLPLLLVLPRPSYAFEFNDLWLRPDQQGQSLLQQEQPAAAAKHFENPQWQGMALYQAGEYAEAAKRFNQGNNADDHYNRGNALAKQGELEAALDAYETALERQPNLSQAQANYELIKQLLEQQKQQESQEQQSSEQQQSDNSDSSKNQQNQQNQPGQQQGQNAPDDQSSQPGSDPGESQNSPSNESSDNNQNQDNPAQPEAGKDQTSPQNKQDDNQSAKPGNSQPTGKNRIDDEPLDANGGATGQSKPSKPATADDQQANPENLDGDAQASITEPSERTDSEQPELDEEGRQALEQWLRQIPDDPAELLRRKFWYEQQQHQEAQ